MFVEICEEAAFANVDDERSTADSLFVVVRGDEAASRAGIVTPFLLPPLSAVLGRVWEDTLSGEVAVNLGLTLYRALAGFRSPGSPGWRSAS